MPRLLRPAANTDGCVLDTKRPHRSLRLRFRAFRVCGLALGLLARPRHGVALCYSLLWLFSASSAAAHDTTAVVYLSADDAIRVGTQFYEGDHISTCGGLMLKLPDGSDIELGENTAIRMSQFRKTPQGATTRIELSRGAIRSRVIPGPGPGRSGTVYKIVTPISTTGVRGTDFSVAYRPASSTATFSGMDAADVDVFEGSVEVWKEASSSSSEVIDSGAGATVTRRGFARRALADSLRQRWRERRQFIIDHMRRKFGLGPDDKIETAIGERLKSLFPEKQQQIRDRLQRVIEETRGLWKS